MNRSKQGGNQGNDVENGETGLHLKLKTRHLKMVAIGGSIGTSLSVASGSAVATGDPAALVLDFAIAGFMLFNVCIALGELAVTFPVSGSFAVYSSHFLDPTWGFAMVIAIVGFIILGILLIFGIDSNRVYFGFQYWHDPGAFANGYKEVCSVFVTAGFAFVGTELVDLAAAETGNPRIWM
ncbi:unnamed protein product [Rotaria sp. Silwood1]|nr:unnamed protein product [Rotaria sp. Silwood1]